jgi:hypothetical protein
MEIYVHVDRRKPPLCGLSCCSLMIGIILIGHGTIDKDTGILQIVFGSLCMSLSLVGFTYACFRSETRSTVNGPLEVITVNPIGQGTECSICMDSPRVIAFIPCGHSVCITCSGELKECPLCRASIKDRLRLY